MVQRDPIHHLVHPRPWATTRIQLVYGNDESVLHDIDGVLSSKTEPSDDVPY
jgi:hypothetical protein